MSGLKKVWFTNMSEVSKPLLSLAITVDNKSYTDQPLMFTSHPASNISIEEHHYYLSFLSPDDLKKLKEAIEIAEVANYDNQKMIEIRKARQQQTITYAIGFFNPINNEYGMLYGPTSDLKDVLSIDMNLLSNPHQLEREKAVILEFKNNEVNEVYEWDRKFDQWNKNPEYNK